MQIIGNYLYIGTAVAASPVGLAGYILEKFSTWTNKEYISRADGGLFEKFTIDELLDNIMLYWVTNSLTTSARLYSEQFNTKHYESKIDEYVSLPFSFLKCYLDIKSFTLKENTENRVHFMSLLTYV